MAKTSAPRDEAPQTSPDVAAVENFQKRFNQSYLDYVTGLQSVYLNTQRRFGEAYGNYAEQLAQELRKALPVDAYRRYVQALQAAAGQSDAQTRIAEATREYVGVLQEANVSIQRSYEEGVRWLVETLQEAWKDTQTQVKDQHRGYAQSLQDTWSQASSDTMDAHTLAAIGRTIMAAALTAGAVSLNQPQP